MERFIKRLFPRESPLQLITDHSKICSEVSLLTLKALEVYFSGGDLSEIERKVDKLEGQSDHIKSKLKEIYVKLKWSYFDRMEVHSLITAQEKLVDVADDIVKFLQMNFVENLKGELKEKILKLAEEVKKAVDGMVKAAEELSRLVESDFSPSEVGREEKIAEEVEREESETDELGKKIGRELFSMKNSMNPVDVIFLERVVTLLMEMADLAENAAERIRDLNP